MPFFEFIILSYSKLLCNYSSSPSKKYIIEGESDWHISNKNLEQSGQIFCKKNHISYKVKLYLCSCPRKHLKNISEFQ